MDEAEQNRRTEHAAKKGLLSLSWFLILFLPSFIFGLRHKFSGKIILVMIAVSFTIAFSIANFTRLNSWPNRIVTGIGVTFLWIIGELSGILDD